MTRIAVAILLTLAFSLSGSVALAGQPVHRACIGHDVSGYAQAGGSTFGAFVSGGASATQGLGDEIQAHQAGLVPDSVLPNSCND